MLINSHRIMSDNPSLRKVFLSEGITTGVAYVPGLAVPAVLPVRSRYLPSKINDVVKGQTVLKLAFTCVIILHVTRSVCTPCFTSDWQLPLQSVLDICSFHGNQDPAIPAHEIFQSLWSPVSMIQPLYSFNQLIHHFNHSSMLLEVVSLYDLHLNGNQPDFLDLKMNGKSSKHSGFLHLISRLCGLGSSIDCSYIFRHLIGTRRTQ